MTDTIQTSEDGRTRVRLVHDDDPVHPREEYDHLGHVITIHHSRYTDIDKNAGPLADVWDEALSLTADRGAAVDLFERYCRIYHLAATLYDTPHEGPSAIWYLAAEDFWQVENPAEFLKGERNEYRNWAEGDVWGHVIEHEVKWGRVNTPAETMTTWETVESCWGFIGREYAEEAAREAFADHQKPVPDTV